MTDALADAGGFQGAVSRLHNAGHVGHAKNPRVTAAASPVAYQGLVLVYDGHEAPQEQHVDGNVVANARPLHLHCYRRPCRPQDALVHLRMRSPMIPAIASSGCEEEKVSGGNFCHCQRKEKKKLHLSALF